MHTSTMTDGRAYMTPEQARELAGRIGGTLLLRDTEGRTEGRVQHPSVEGPLPTGEAWVTDGFHGWERARVNALLADGWTVTPIHPVYRLGEDGEIPPSVRLCGGARVTVLAEGEESGFRATVANGGDRGDEVAVEPGGVIDAAAQRVVSKARLRYGWST